MLTTAAFRKDTELKFHASYLSNFGGVESSLRIRSEAFFTSLQSNIMFLQFKMTLA